MAKMEVQKYRSEPIAKCRNRIVALPAELRQKISFQPSPVCGVPDIVILASRVEASGCGQGFSSHGQAHPRDSCSGSIAAAFPEKSSTELASQEFQRAYPGL